MCFVDQDHCNAFIDHYFGFPYAKFQTIAHKSLCKCTKESVRIGDEEELNTRSLS